MASEPCGVPLPPPDPVIVEVSPSIVEQAQTLANEMGAIRNSILSGRGNLAGFIGEVVVADLLGVKTSNTFDYDLVLGDGRTVDVKTKQTSRAPLVSYDASVAAASGHQKCDLYVFTRLLRENERMVMYVMGWIPRADFYLEATPLKAGWIDASNGWTVSVDCYNLAYEKMNNIRQLMP